MSIYSSTHAANNDNRLVVANSAAVDKLNVTGRDYTFSFWFRLDRLTAAGEWFGMLASYDTSTTVNHGWEIWCEASGKGPVFSTNGTSGTFGFLYGASFPTVNAGRWYHWTITHKYVSASSAVITYYQNGAQVHRYISSGTDPTPVIPTFTGNVIIIGGNGDNGAPVGHLADVRIFSKVLRQDEITRTMMSNSTPSDLLSSCLLDLPLSPKGGTVYENDRSQNRCGVATLSGTLTWSHEPPISAQPDAQGAGFGRKPYHYALRGAIGLAKTYYVRKTGSDSNTGLSAGAAWQTMGKVFGATGNIANVQSGDTVYVGAGLYREAIAAYQTSGVSTGPTETINIIGDVDGLRTGDAGEVRWSPSVSTELRQPSNTTLINLNGRGWLALQNLVLEGGNGGLIVTSPVGAVATGHFTRNVSLTNCAVMIWPGTAASSTTNAVTYTSQYGIPANITLDRCQLFGVVGLSFTLATGATGSADYDANILIRNCVVAHIGSAICVQVAVGQASGAQGGGLRVQNCTYFGSAGFVSTGVNSTTYPSTVTNCVIFRGGSSGATLSAGTVGNLTEDYNILSLGQSAGTGLVNITQGTHTSVNQAQARFHFGQEQIWGGLLRPLFTPTYDSPANMWGSAAAPPSVDLLNRPRPAAGIYLGPTGTATSGAAQTLTDSGATWGLDAYADWTVKITGGTGSGQTKVVKSNTGTVLTVYSNWTTTPDNTSTYMLYKGALAETGIATSGASGSLTVSNATWTASMWVGWQLVITAGTAVGNSAVITASSATALTAAGIGTPDATSQFAIVRPQATGASSLVPAAGALERHDAAQREATTFDVTPAIRLMGQGDQQLLIPVDATSTTITVKARYDSQHAATTKPQASILVANDIGVAAQTVTMTAAANTWETLTFSAFTPTGKGWVILRLQARASNADGAAFFDTISVS